MEAQMELEAFAFIAGVFIGSTDSNRKITETEAEFAIKAWEKEGINVPPSLNPQNFTMYWNDILMERKDELD